MAGATIELRFTDADAERRFLATELPAAWERFESSEYWDQGWFWPYSHFADYDVGVDGGLVRLVFDGDPDGLVAAESERWEAFEGLTDWNLRRYEEEGFESLLAQQRDAKGEVSGERDGLRSPSARSSTRDFPRRPRARTVSVPGCGVSSTRCTSSVATTGTTRPTPRFERCRVV